MDLSRELNKILKKYFNLVYTERTTATWKTREGKIIPIVDLQDDHLLNCISMLERKAIKLVEGMFKYTPTGREARRATVRVWPILKELEKEAKYRNLKCKGD